MLPLLLRFEWAGITFRLGAYPFLVFCGVWAASWIALRRARQAHLPTRRLLWVMTGSLCVAFVGARFAYFLQCGGTPFRGGFVLYGGLLAGLITGLGLARAAGLPVLRVADLAAPCILLGTAFGRLGCILAGCCYGAVCESGISYPRGSHAFRDQLRHGLIGANAPESLPTMPIALFESAVLVIFFVLASKLWRRQSRPGTVLATVGILYPAWRFIAEIFRADNLPYWGDSLTFSQGISLVCLIMAAILLLRIRRKPVAPPLPAVDYPRASAVQGLAMLALVGLSLAGLSCASHHSHESSGVSTYRKKGPAAPGGNDPKGGDSKESKGGKGDSDDFFSSCISDCTGECIDDCTDSMCEDSCGGNNDESGGTEGTDEAPRRSILGRLQSRKSYPGSLAFEAAVNERLRVVLKLQGSLSVHGRRSDGCLPVHLALKSIELTVGEQRWKGEGELDLAVGPTGSVAVVKSSLPPDLTEALASLDGVAGNFLEAPLSPVPDTELRKTVQEILGTSKPRAGFSMVTTFEGKEKWARGEATVIEDPPGTYSLQWVIRH